jgi:pseudouridine synthase
MSTEKIRLHRFIAQSGLCSRRNAEVMIAEGRVMVNGDLITEMGVKVDENDDVQVDNKSVKPLGHKVCLMNKPKGYVTTVKDTHGRQTVMQLLPGEYRMLKPVGRLDMDTSGLLLLTNDGDLAMRLTHARFGVEKEYIAEVSGTLTDAALKSLVRGVRFEGTIGKAVSVEVLNTRKKHVSVLKLVLHEGQKRQIRLMLETVGNPVIELTRVRIGHLGIKGMRPGEVKLLPMKDVARLKSSVGLE